ncbi:DnaD domain protein [Clostridium estertheticum]|uniref:DnaD domain-containing protein n=1 Tax=Clostridium estertheticum TaxID=238834 RepID=UPI0013EE6358|nr:DnaD domain protein [Clostridium estertheticum]MBZ9607302.1 DnaD domain protein [Clostridium estertheticum]
MAKYRQLYTEFWSDSFVLELTSEEKFFYLYLLTNTKTTQSGIYELSKRFIEIETGINKETVDKLIKKFCEHNKILYCEETKEIMVLNWIKYNVPNSPNSIKCVNKEVIKVKNKKFVKILFEKCVGAKLDVEKIFESLIINESFDSGVEVVEIQTDKIFSRGLQGACKMLPSNRIRSNKEETINKKQETINKEEEVQVITKKEALTKKQEIKYENNSSSDYEGLKNIIRIFEENVHAISPLEYEKILGFTNNVTNEVIIMAIEEAVNYNAKTMKYITKILNSWISNGLKTDYEVRAYQIQWANKKNGYLGKKVKKSGFCDYEQRTYDFDALEKQLLGIA